MIPDVGAFSMPPRITSLTGQLYRMTAPWPPPTANCAPPVPLGSSTGSATSAAPPPAWRPTWPIPPSRGGCSTMPRRPSAPSRSWSTTPAAGRPTPSRPSGPVRPAVRPGRRPDHLHGLSANNGHRTIGLMTAEGDTQEPARPTIHCGRSVRSRRFSAA